MAKRKLPAPIEDAVRTIIGALEQSNRKGLFQWRPKPVSEVAVEAAVEVLAHGDPEQVLPLAAELLDRDVDGACFRLNSLVLALAESLPIGAWPRMDEAIRNALFSGRVKPVLRYHAAEDLLALCDPSGHTRADAIQKRGTLPALLRASLLFVRLNDWAPQVRDLAERNLPLTIRELGASDRMKLVPLLERLRNCGRHTFRGIQAMEAWRAGLVGSLDEEAWLSCWHTATGRERGLYLRILKGERSVPGPRVRRALLESSDRMALLWFIRSILPSLPPTERDVATAWFETSKSVPVRREWLTHLIEVDPGAAVPQLAGLLLNPSRSLRQFARFYLERFAPMDFAAHYRAAFENPARAVVALQGLCETSSTEGHALALRCLDAADLALKKTALLCLPEESLFGLVDRLLVDADEPWPGIAKAARKRLGDVGQALGAHLVSEPSQWTGFSDNLRGFLLVLCPSFSKWDGLELLLKHGGLLDVHLLSALVSKWLYRENRAFIRLSPGRRQTLLELSGASWLPEAQRVRFAFILREATG